MSFTNLNEQFHIFSKSPVRAGQTLGSARNKSGHTVTTSDIWAEDIPALFYAYTTNQRNNFKNIASDNDLCYDKEIDTLYYFKSGSLIEQSGSWIERIALDDGEILFNSNAAKNGIYNDGLNNKSVDYLNLGVVQYHKGKPVEAITSSNNNESAGNGYTGRIKKDNGTYISQFISSMDKLVSGNPSSYYEPIILNGSNIMEESSEDTTEKKYIANSYAGVIQFHQDGFKIDETTGNFVGIKASVFEYIGKKLDSTLSNISEDLNSDLSDKGVHVVQTNGKIESITVTPVTITNGSITSNGDNVISGNQVVSLINNAKTELLAAGVQYKVLAPSEQLPKASETYKGCIYLMPESTRISGSYLEYMCVQKEDNTWTWEQIGTTKTDLNDYITDEEFEEHSNNDDIHVTSNDKNNWDNKIDSITGDDFIDIDIDADDESKITLSLNTTEEIIDSDVHVPTSKAVYRWHDDNGFEHVELYTPQPESSTSTNQSTGDICSGFIFNSPILIKLSYFRIYGYLKSVIPPSGGSNFDFYVKIIDPKSGHILAVSEKPVARKVNGVDCDADVHFSEENQPLLPKDTDFKVIFSSNNDEKDDTNDRTFQIAFGIQRNYIYSNGKTILGDNNQQGYFTQQYFTEPHGELKEPPNIITITAGLTQTTENCIGVHVVPFGKFNKTDEFNDIAYEALKIYKHTDEQNQDVTDHINNTDIHFSYKVLQEPSSSTSTFDNCDTSKCYVSTDSGQGDGVFAIEYSKAHFVPSTLIKKITIPYDNATSTGISSNSRNLVLEVFKNSNDVTPSDVFFSNNTDSYTNSKNEYSFTFDNLILPDDYAFVRISITSHISTDAEGNKTRTKYEKFRIIPLRVNGETNKGEEGNIFEIDDECKIYWSYSENTDTLSQQKNFIANFIAEYQPLILHKNNEERHVTSSERTSWNNKISGIIEGDTIINCELDQTSKAVTLSLKQDEVFKKSVCVCDIQSLEEDGKEYIIYDDSCSPKYISFAEKITNGESMFMNQLLKHFRINLHNMTNGKNMFMNCTLLQHFDSDLTSLTEAKDMFGYCCLSLKSVKNIADKINTVTSGDLGILGINSKYQNNEELNEALAILTSKGWTHTEYWTKL